jgi:hypothetical protein
MRGALRAALLLFFLSAAWAPRVSAFGLQSDDSGLNVALESRWTSGALDARIQAVRALGAPDLGAESAPQRAAELAAIVRAGREKSLRDAALDTLALVEGPVAEALLIEFVRGLAADEDWIAAKGLVARSATGAALLELLKDSLGVTSEKAPVRLRSQVLVALLDGFDEAYVAAGTRDDAWLMSAAKAHTDGEVRDAADKALLATLNRLGDHREDARAMDFLERLHGAGWAAVELDLNGALYLLKSGRELERAAELAHRVIDATRGSSAWEALRHRFLGTYLLSAALLAEGEAQRAYDALQGASLVLDGLILRRSDLTPLPVKPSKVGGRLANDALILRGLVELFAAHAALAAGAQPGDARVLQHLRAAHEFSLWAQLRELSTNDQAGYGSFDELFDHDLSPRRLVFSAPDNAIWSGPGRAAALDVMLKIGQAAALIGGEEVPGFRAPTAAVEGFGPPREDPRRATLLKLMVPAELTAVQRRLNQSWDANEMQILELRRRALSDAIQRAEDENYPDLEGLRVPSLYALTMASDLDRENRSEESVELAERLFADMDAAGRLDDGAGGSWLAARIELELGGALGEAGRPRDAIGVLESAVRRLEAIENTLIERRTQETDARRLSLFDAQIKQTQTLRSQVLVALAVNANVRLGDPTTALAYFESAYALDDSEFMRGLLACYRARFGAKEEARALLRTIRPAPATYYNLACAWALLGEPANALDMLARELSENHRSPGALARQKRWAREDPDLSSLVENERFIELTRP